MEQRFSLQMQDELGRLRQEMAEQTLDLKHHLMELRSQCDRNSCALKMLTEHMILQLQRAKVEESRQRHVERLRLSRTRDKGGEDEDAQHNKDKDDGNGHSSGDEDDVVVALDKALQHSSLYAAYVAHTKK
jgi:hypothetical protein